MFDLIFIIEKFYYIMLFGKQYGASVLALYIKIFDK